MQSNTNIKDRSGAFVTGKLLNQADALAKAAKDKTARARSSSTLQGAQVSVEYNDTCLVSGSVQLSGHVDDVTKLGSLSVSFVDCNDGQVIINGSASLEANAYNAEIDEYTDVVLNYNNLHHTADRVPKVMRND